MVTTTLAQTSVRSSWFSSAGQPGGVRRDALAGGRDDRRRANRRARGRASTTLFTRRSPTRR